MKYRKTKYGVELEVEEFLLKETFECGQCFRWHEVSENAFSGVAKGKSLTILNRGNKIILKDISLADFEDLWYHYFDLNTDYVGIKNELSKRNPCLSEIVKFSTGIRILNQDPWESLCSFIISQNNNIPRIMGIVSKMCSSFGNQIDDNNFDFPSASKIASLDEEDLSILKAGFRTKYILDAAKKVSSGELDLDLVRSMPINEARNSLMKIYGVGPKVADCTLLYGFHRLDAFPIDVWIKKALKVLFNEINPSEFGPYAGVAQQYIFHYSRMNKEIFDFK